MSLRTLSRIGAGAGIALLLAAAPRPAAAQAAVKVAVIDVQRIITDSQTGKRALAQLEGFHKEQQGRIDVKRDEMQLLRQRISEGQLSLSEEKLEELQKELETKNIEARRAADDATREFNRRQEEILKNIERQVMPIIQKMGQEGGYTMILRKFDSGLVYADDAIDITAQVITRLDGSSQGG